MSSNGQNMKNRIERTHDMDRRIVKTQSDIKKAFISLLDKKPIQKITISGLTDCANISRSTFYLHYHDIYDLWDQIESDVISELGLLYSQYIKEDDQGTNIGLFIERTLTYIYLNQSIFKTLQNTEDNLLNSKKLINYFKKRILEELHERPVSHAHKKIESTFIVSGIVGVFEDWIKDGMNQKPEEISNALHKILSTLDMPYL